MDSNTDADERSRLFWVTTGQCGAHTESKSMAGYDSKRARSWSALVSLLVSLLGRDCRLRLRWD